MLSMVSRSIARVSPVLMIASGMVAFAGFGLEHVHQAPLPLASGLMKIGAAMAAVTAACHTRHSFSGYPIRSLISRVGVVAGVAALVVGVFSLNVWAHKHEQRLDLTAGATNTLDAATIACLGRLKEPVQITALYAGKAPDMVRDLLLEVERFGHGKVTQEIVDPLVNIGYAAQFGPRIDGQEARVVVRTVDQDGKAGRREEINCKETELSEGRLTAALIKLTNGRKKVYFTSGHQELDPTNTKDGGISAVVEALERQNIGTAKWIPATMGEVPADCNVLVIAGARRELATDEKQKIVNYQRKGGAVLLLIESSLRLPAGETKAGKEDWNPRFNDMLADWGVQVGDDVVVDMANHVGSDVGCPATTTYPPHDKIVNELGVTFYIRPRSLTFTKRSSGLVRYASLVKTMGAETSWGETDPGLFVHYDEGKDNPGPVDIAAVLVREADRDKSAPHAYQQAAKMIVIANAGFVTNEFAGRYSNLDFVVNCAAWLADREPMLDSKDVRAVAPKLQVTAKDLRRATVIMGLTPLLIMSTGLLVWWRRHRRVEA